MGIEAYFKQVNADGGVAGRSLKLVSLDDGYEPTRAVANTKTFIDGGDVFALLGYVGTPATLAAKPLIDQAGIPLIGPFTGATFMRGRPRRAGASRRPVSDSNSVRNAASPTARPLRNAASSDWHCGGATPCANRSR